MSRVPSKNTGLEIAVRKLVWAMGYRYRLHARDLPGKPDIVFRGRRKVIFVHGCFWHRHPGCRYASMPKTRQAFWREKFDRNIARDAKHMLALQEMGWSVIVVWQCEMRDPDAVAEKIAAFLGSEIGKLMLT